LLVDFLEMPAPAIPIPILVATDDADAIVSGGVPEGLPVGIDSLGDLGELVQHGVPAAAFGAGTAVVGGGRGEAAAGGLRWEREERGRPGRGERNGKLLRREGERRCGNGRRSHEREWICVLLKKKDVCCECEVKGMEHEAVKIASIDFYFF